MMKCTIANANNVHTKHFMITLCISLCFSLRAACELVNNKVAGIFGPQDKSTESYVQGMCDTLDIPHIAARWDSEPKRGNVINLYPHSDTLSMVLILIYKPNNL